MDENKPLVIRARGPVEVAGEIGHLSPVRPPSQGLPLLARVLPAAGAAMMAVSSVVVGTTVAGAGVAVFGVVGLLLYWRYRGIALGADRSGLRVKGELWSWDDVDRVDDDLIRWRLEDGEGRHQEAFEHAVVVTRSGIRTAFWVGSQAEAERIAKHLDFLRRQSSGRPEDVPDELRSLGERATRPTERG